MLVKMKNNKAAVMYRGVAFIGSDPVEVSQNWFEGIKTPRIVEVKAKKASEPSQDSETE